MSEYRSQAARDAERAGYGDRSYWDYLEKGEIEKAEKGYISLTRSLSEALRGNGGD